MPETFARFNRILGIDNFNDPTSVLPTDNGSYVVEAVNVDIDNKYSAHRRSGRTITALTGSYHSLWNNPGQTICLGCSGTTLYKITKIGTTYSATSILTGINPVAKMKYVEVADKIYYTNNSVIGYIKDSTAYSFTAPTEEYKSTMLPGHDIEWYNSRLYVTRNNVIWFSDAMYPGRYDKRKNFMMFPNRITLMKSVSDGMWIGAGNIYFLAGLDPAETIPQNKGDYDAIEGTGVKVDLSAFGDGSGQSKIVIFLSEKGVCIGGQTGQFKNLTVDKYVMPTVTEGSAIYRQFTGTDQYISITH